MIPGDRPRMQKYHRFYFQKSYNLVDIMQTDMLMLHNSWTPGWYKQMSEDEVLKHGCTMSNMIRRALQYYPDGGDHTDKDTHNRQIK